MRAPGLKHAKPFLPVAAALLLVGLDAASAESRRIYQTPDRWLTIDAGRLGVTRFFPDGPQGERSFGSASETSGVYALIQASLQDTLEGLGLYVDPTPACEERPGTNLKGSQGYAFTCRYSLTDTPMPIAAPPSPPAPLPAKAALISAPPAAKITAQPAAQPAALATPAPEKSAPTSPPPPPAVVKASTPVPPAAPIAPAPEAEADQLNAKVRAALDAAEARDRQKQADYEAAQKKAADDFARQMADHDARVKAQKAEYEAKLNAQKAEYEASMAAWRARVAACKAGDASQCADSSVPPPGAK